MMNHIVFISGSRTGSLFDNVFKNKIKEFADNGYEFIIGDCQGIDILVQNYLAELEIKNVSIYFSTDSKISYRNLNTKYRELNWKLVPVITTVKPYTREFYTAKDNQMLYDADTLLVCWDGKSLGSKNNIIKGKKLNKNILVYTPDKNWYIYNTSQDNPE